MADQTDNRGWQGESEEHAAAAKGESPKHGSGSEFYEDISSSTPGSSSSDSSSSSSSSDTNSDHNSGQFEEGSERARREGEKGGRSS